MLVPVWAVSYSRGSRDLVLSVNAYKSLSMANALFKYRHRTLLPTFLADFINPSRQISAEYRASF